MAKNPLKITDTILRDAHQSQAATRMRLEDMLPACELLDNMGYWSLECWGGATFDACMRFLNEDPWERLRALRKAMPKTKLQMLLRGQNILGYKHYADDVVEEFCKKSIENGIDVVRIFGGLVLKLGHTGELAEHGVAVEHPAQLRVSGDVALDEQRHLVRVEAAGDVLRELLQRAAGYGDGMHVHDAVVGLVVVYHVNPVLDGAHVGAQRQVAGGLYAREHYFSFINFFFFHGE